MQVVEAKQFGGPETLELIEENTPMPSAGQVVIEVKAAGVNFMDILVREGLYPPSASAPAHPGQEVAGVVSQRGDGVQGFQRGTRVMAFVPGGGYASHAALDTADVYALPDGLDFAPATALLVQGVTAYFLLETGQLSPGGTVLIPSAAGGVGSLAVQIAKLKGAGKVIGLASPGKHEFVRSLGADAVFDYTQAGWSKDVLAETDGAGIDVFLDSQGELGSEAFDALAAKAHWLVYGAQSGSSSVLTTERLRVMQGKNITLRGYNAYANVAEWGRGVQEMLGWATSGNLKIAVTRFPLADAAKAHEAISARQTTGKVVLEP